MAPFHYERGHARIYYTIMEIRDRIIKIQKVRAGDILHNPKNWRIHPNAQREAMGGALRELGAADVLKAYYSDGKLVFLDGHLRQEIDLDHVWYVAIMDFNEEEAAEYIATHDTITGMAEIDKEILTKLLAEVKTSEPALATMMANLAKLAGIGTELGEAPEAKLDKADELQEKWQVSLGNLFGLGKFTKCPKCGKIHNL